MKLAAEHLLEHGGLVKEAAQRVGSEPPTRGGCAGVQRMKYPR